MTIGNDIGDVASAFRAGFRGEVIGPEDPAYDAARHIWNGMIERHPLAIARCRTIEDIRAAVRLCRENGSFPAVRGGGHSIAGLSTSDDVVIDLSAMRQVRVDAERRLAFVDPGATWADFDRATSAFGLASTGGLVSTTGVAGLTLGGGIGWLQRRYGLACDNLVGAEVVTASGDVVRADRDTNPELLWALRGGGGNFGIVATFEFALHPVGEILGGMLLFPLERGREVLAAFRNWTGGLPDEGTMLAAILTAPPEPFVPADLVGKPAVAVVGCWCGGLGAGTQALAPMRVLAPAVDRVGPMPYPALQGMLDAGAPAGLRNYFRTGFLEALSDAFIDRVLEYGARMPSPLSAVHIHQMGGAVGRPDAVGSAFGNRRAAFTYNLVSTWVAPADDDLNMSANRAVAADLAPLSLGGAYVNFVSEQTPGSAQLAYGEDTYERLAAVKREYDPTNLFRRNHNISPDGAA